MQVFKAFLKVLKSRIGIAAVYIVIFLAVGFFISRLDNGTEVWQQTKMNLMIVDRDGSAASKALTEFLSGSNTIVEGVENTDDLMDALYYGRVDYAITIPEGFEARLNAGETENLLGNLLRFNMDKGVSKEDLSKEREKLSAAARERATDNLRIDFAVDAIRAERKIELSGDEFNAFLNRVIREQRLSEAQVKELSKNRMALRSYHRAATREKVLAALLEKAKPTAGFNA